MLRAEKKRRRRILYRLANSLDDQAVATELDEDIDDVRRIYHDENSGKTQLLRSERVAEIKAYKRIADEKRRVKRGKVVERVSDIGRGR